MRARPRIRHAVVPSIVLALAACANAPEPAAEKALPRFADACPQAPGWWARLTEGAGNDAPPEVTMNAVRYLQPGLDKAVQVRALDAGRSAGGELTVLVHFLNCTEQRIVIGARTSFLDDRRLPLGTPSAWQRVHLAPRSTGTYTERPLGVDASHFIVEVRDDGGVQQAVPGGSR